MDKIDEKLLDMIKENARIARNYFEKMIMNQANRLVQSGHMEKRYLCRFTREDLPKTLEIKPMKSM